ncbi:MAG TPA: HD domain-containing protein [Mesotoga infera]|uniref:HD domain-containing protein n=1 Tax=Mesotoga infera TaxID=1236046 RepID=A0A7C1CTV9_9BACT|nr:HD domain-containing protein [Mesotoga infera]
MSKTVTVSLWILIALASWAVSRLNFLLFHSFIEITAILIAGVLVSMAFISRGKNVLVLRMGYLYSVVMFLDVLHTISYAGMGVFPSWTANQPTQFWILGRLIEASGLALALVLPKKRSLNIGYFAGFMIAGALGTMAIALGYFPDCFIPGTGLTSFKISMEYVVIGIILLSIYILFKSNSPYVLPYRKHYFLALLMTAAGEIVFTTYTDVYGFSNMLGHVFRVISYFVILQGIVYRSIREPIDSLYNRISKTQEELIAIMSETTEIKDPYTAGHQKRVAILADEIARKMRLSQDDRNVLSFASRLHDIGKLFIPTDILSKAMFLNEQERDFIELHPGKSYDLMKGIPFEGSVLDTILQHHERLDGSGYPEGLTDKEILLTSKILSVADVVEAMLSERPYRRAHSVEEAMEEIGSNSGKLYDSSVVNSCLELFQSGFSFKAHEE